MRLTPTHAPRRARAVLTGLATVSAALAIPGLAAAQTTTAGTPPPPPGTVPSTPPVPVPTVPPPNPPTTPTAPDGPPRLDSLKLRRTVSAQRGHAQFLVGVRLSHAARVRVAITALPSRAPVKTVATTEVQQPGRVYLLIEATNERRLQMPAGRYAVAVTATDEERRSSAALTGTFTLKLTTARGRLDVFTVPLWPTLARTLRVPARGVLVAALAPRGAAVRAGIRRGDVITSVNNRQLTGPGALLALLRSLPAGQPVSVQVLRAGAAQTLTVTPPADWNGAPDFEAPLRVIVRRDPNVLAFAYAQVRQLVDAGRRDEALDLLDDWRPAWRRQAVYHLLQGDILHGNGDHRRALGAYNRAAAADPGMAAAKFGQGLALAALDRDAEAVRAFGSAASLDPTDAVAQAFRSYLLIRTDQFPQALDAANRAVALDRLYEDGHIARALALISATRTADGVAALKRGLVLLADQTRAAALIDRNLEPNEP